MNIVRFKYDKNKKYLYEYLIQNEKNSYLNLSKIEKKLYLLEDKATYIGPFNWNELIYQKQIPKRFYSVLNEEKTFYYLNHIKTNYKYETINIFRTRLNEITINFRFDKDIIIPSSELNQINLLFSKFLDYSLIMDENNYINNLLNFISSNRLLNTIYNKLLQNKNTIYSINILDTNIDKIPFEIFQIFLANCFIVYHLNTIASPNIMKLAEPISRYKFFYTNPAPENVENDIDILVQNNIACSLFSKKNIIYDNSGNLILSAHGNTQNEIASIYYDDLLLAKNDFKLLENFEFILFLSCNLQYFENNNNILFNLAQKNLSEFIICNYKIKDRLTEKFLDLFSKNIYKYKSNFFNYTYCIKKQNKLSTILRFYSRLF